MKVLCAHDWLNGFRGGEKCLESILKLYPNSEIFTLFHEKGKLPASIESKPIHTSFIQNIPMAKKKYRFLLPFFPAAIESFKPKSADLVISTSHCVAKGFKKPNPNTPHVSYIFTPMRYAWLFFDEYFGHYPAPFRWMIRQVIKRLQVWDRRTSKDVNHFVAISEHIRKRVQDFYGRDADVIYPPVETDFYTPDSTVKREDFYLLVGALVPYKRADLVIEVFNKLGKKLIVIGSGPESDKLRAIAGPTVEFKGWQTDDTIRSYYRRCRALIFPQEEDFGIVPVEAQACAAPVIAYAKGGALETIVKNVSGIFFENQTENDLIQAIAASEKVQWNADAIRTHAEKFSEKRFREEFKVMIDSVLNNQNIRSRSESSVS